jgi:hypothetical protein
MLDKKLLHIRHRLPCWIGVIYLASFFLPTIDGFPYLNVGQGGEAYIELPFTFRIGNYHSGWNVFLQLAYLVMLTPQLSIFAIPAWVWWANPFFWFALVLFWRGRWRAAGFWGSTSVLLGLVAALFELDTSSRFPRVLHIGYFLWLASLMLLAGAGLGYWVCLGRRHFEASRPVPSTE